MQPARCQANVSKRSTTSTSRFAVFSARESSGTCWEQESLFSVLIRLRPVQRDVIVATLEGEDVFLQAATSFGKSLCFQLPAIVDFGSTLHGPWSDEMLIRSSYHCHIAASCLDGTLVIPKRIPDLTTYRTTK
jgi:hypothetical protein